MLGPGLRARLLPPLPRPTLRPRLMAVWRRGLGSTGRQADAGPQLVEAVPAPVQHWPAPRAPLPPPHPPPRPVPMAPELPSQCESVPHRKGVPRQRLCQYHSGSDALRPNRGSGGGAPSRRSTGRQSDRMLLPSPDHPPRPDPAAPPPPPPPPQRGPRATSCPSPKSSRASWRGRHITQKSGSGWRTKRRGFDAN